MKPTAFERHAPRTVDETLKLLSDYGDDAKILAGGQSLVPLLNFRLATPGTLIDINGVDELAGTDLTGETIRFGALTRTRSFETRPEVARVCPLLAQAAPYIAHPQIRTRGTFGGSLAHADPSAELPGVAVALEATVRLLSTRGERRVAAHDFFEYHLTTALEPDELLAEIEIRKPGPRHGSSFLEVAARHGDFASAGTAVVVETDPGGAVTDARIACISVGPTPVRMTVAERLLIGATEIDDALAGELRDAVAKAIEPTGALRASALYKKRVSGVLVRDAARQALARAKEAV